MDLGMDEYQAGTEHTAVYRQAAALLSDDPIVVRLLRINYAALELGESGEIQNKVKKILRDSMGCISDNLRSALAKELGDMLYACASLATELGLSLSQIGLENLAKLADRKARGTLQGSGDDR